MHSKPPSSDHAETSLKVAVRILRKWGCSIEQQCAILQLPWSSCAQLEEHTVSLNLNKDQVERISYVLNIHAALRGVFENSANVYGYVTMKNASPPFNGQAPLDLLSTGQLEPLVDIFKHVDSMILR